MPKPLQGVDWPLAQAWFVQGIEYCMIAEKLGVTPATLRQHAYRHQWRKLRNQASAPQSIIVPMQPSLHRHP